MIYIVECSKNVEETQAGNLLMADGRDQFVVQRDKQSFCGMVLSEARLVGIEK